MANAVSLWSESVPSHFSSPALGTPRTPRQSEPRSIRDLAASVARRTVPEARGTSNVAIAIESPMLEQDSRMAATAECRAVRERKTTFRSGAAAPAKSSLGWFVLIGFAVGLFAFAMMTFCLPDPGQEIAARAAK